MFQNKLGTVQELPGRPWGRGGGWKMGEICPKT